MAQSIVFKCISILVYNIDFTKTIFLTRFESMGSRTWWRKDRRWSRCKGGGSRRRENVGIHLITLRCLPRLILSESCSTGTLMVCWSCDQADLFSVQQHWHSELRVLEHGAAGPVCRNQGWDELAWAIIAWLFRQ